MRAYSQDYLNDGSMMFKITAKEEKVLTRQKPMSIQWTPKNCGNTLPKLKNIP